MRSLTFSLLTFCTTLIPLSADENRQPDLTQVLDAADRSAVNGEFARADELYRRVLLSDGATTHDRARCYRGQQLIYRQTERWGAALAVGLKYHSYLTAHAGLHVRNSDVLKSAIQIADDYLATGQSTAAEALLERTLASFMDKRVDPIQELRVLMILATLAHERADNDVAQKRLGHASHAAKRAIELMDQRILIPGKEGRAFCFKSLATTHALVGQVDLAVVTLQRLLEEQVALGDPSGQRDTLVELARHLGLTKQYAQAADYLQRALGLARQRDTHEVKARAEILSQLAAFESLAGQDVQARAHWRQAADLLETVLDAMTKAGRRRDMAECLRQLRNAYFRTNEFTLAIERGRQLATYYEQTFGSQHPWTQQALMAQGPLNVAAGNLLEALPQLETAEAYWRKRDQPLQTATVLDSLGAVKKAMGELTDAKRLFEEALKLREANDATDRVQIATSYNSLATVHAAMGQYDQAIRLYRQALNLYEEPGGHVERRSSTLLNLALAYKSQNQLEKAIEVCRNSLQLREQDASSDELSRVANYNALANLYRALGQREHAAGRTSESSSHFQTAIGYATNARRICEDNGLRQHDELANALNQLAMISDYSGQSERAAAYWRRALDIYRTRGRSTMAVRTSNHLGVSAYHARRLGEARESFERAFELLGEEGGRPQDRYSTLCNLAAVHHLEGDTKQAIDLLHQAVEVTETPRAGVHGGERERADFFVQFAHAFDLLVDWNLLQNNIESAFEASERSRNRTFLDELRIAGVDLRTTLEGPTGEKLRTRESQLRQQLNLLRAQRNRSEFVKKQAEYDQVWRQIRNVSSIYRSLLTQDQRIATLPDLQREIDGQRALLLYYYVGHERGHLLVMGAGEEAQVFPLLVPRRVELETIHPPNNSAPSSEAIRDPVGIVWSPRGGLLDSDPVMKAGHFNQARGAVLVREYLARLHDPGFTGRNSPLAVALSSIVLPQPVRKLIENRRPEYLLIRRDGPLRRLPFEVLLLEDGDSPRFVLDEFPPITYAPSATIWLNLVNRPVPSQRPSRMLLTVGNPDYSRKSDVGFRALLPPLPATEMECRRVADAFASKFGSAEVTLLTGPNATEANVLADIRDSRIIHIAAHGWLGEAHDNLFGAIALTPPQTSADSSKHDGALEVREIQSLPLSRCEIAVLSACQTNVSSDRPLEAGPSLGRAFLVAGARRVVASHWKVADESTAELMGVFMEEVARQYSLGPSIHFAKALREARRKLRRQAKWSSPYNWGAFVHVGPAT